MKLELKIAFSFTMINSVLRIPFYARIAWTSGLMYGSAFLFASGTIFFANGGPFPADPFFLPYVDSRLGLGMVWLVTKTLLISVTLTNAAMIIVSSVLVGLNLALGVYNLRTNQQRAPVGGGVLPGAVLGLFSTASCCIPSAATFFVGVGFAGIANFFYSFYYFTSIVSVAVLLSTLYLATRQISACKPFCVTKR